jgi:hypothetical protein
MLNVVCQINLQYNTIQLQIIFIQVDFLEVPQGRIGSNSTFEPQRSRRASQRTAVGGSECQITQPRFSFQIYTKANN